MTDERDDAAPPTDRTATADHADSPTDHAMSESTDDPTDEPRTTDEPRFGSLTADDFRGILDRLALGLLTVLAIFTGWGFYGQTTEAIRIWIDPAYQPIALATFNLAVLLVALAGIGHQLRRIRAETGDPTGRPTTD